MIYFWSLLVSSKFFLNSVFKGYKKFGKVVIYEGVIEKFLILILLSYIYINRIDINLNLVIFILCVTLIVNNICAFFETKKYLPLIKYRFQSNKFLNVFYDSWPIFLSSINFFLLGNMSLWMLGYFSNSGELSLFGTAIRLVFLIAIPLNVVETILNPIISKKYHQKKNNELEKIIRSNITIIGIPMIFIVLIIIIFSDLILSIIFGEYFVLASNCLKILCFGQLINLCTGPCAPMLNMTGNQDIVLKCSIISLVVNLSLGLLLIPRFEALGAAITTSSAIITQNLLMYLYSRYKLKINCGIRFLKNP